MFSAGRHHSDVFSPLYSSLNPKLGDCGASQVEFISDEVGLGASFAYIGRPPVSVCRSDCN